MFEHAMNEADIEANERLEAEAWRRAVEGVVRERPIVYRGEEVGREIVTEYSDGLLIQLMKARMPDKYRENFDINVQGRIQHAPLAGLLSEPVTIDATAREVDGDS